MTLFEKLGKRVSISEPQYAVVEYMETVRQPGVSSSAPLTSKGPTLPKEPASRPGLGRLMVQDHKVPRPD